LQAARDAGVSVWRDDRAFMCVCIPPDMASDVAKQFQQQLNEYSREIRELLGCR
jgi:hypothetical protein